MWYANINRFFAQCSLCLQSSLVFVRLGFELGFGRNVWYVNVGTYIGGPYEKGMEVSTHKSATLFSIFASPRTAT